MAGLDLRPQALLLTLPAAAVPRDLRLAALPGRPCADAGSVICTFRATGMPCYPAACRIRNRRRNPADGCRMPPRDGQAACMSAG